MQQGDANAVCPTARVGATMAALALVSAVRARQGTTVTVSMRALAWQHLALRGPTVLRWVRRLTTRARRAHNLVLLAPDR